ncbi:MAG: site-specific integrase [Acidobacteriota bacterium]|nr:site-specific integrase [Acidobacteriota bacterium]
MKLPELVPDKVLTFGDLMTDAVEYAKTHLRTWKGYDWKQRDLIGDFGIRSAAEITSQEIDRWLTAKTKTLAKANRFKAFFSLCFRLGMENGKLQSNPARLVRMRRENNARLRFLGREEYDRLLTVIRRDFPRQAPAFIVSVYTGMRWEEQFCLAWQDVRLRRKIIRLVDTKTPNSAEVRSRNVPFNSVALAALQEQHKLVPHAPADLVFPEAGDYCRFWFEPSLVAAKVKDYTWHCNRHTLCSWLVQADVSLKAIQDLSGQKTIAMVARYAHLAPNDLKAASECMV